MQYQIHPAQVWLVLIVMISLAVSGAIIIVSTASWAIKTWRETGSITSPGGVIFSILTGLILLFIGGVAGGGVALAFGLI